MLAHKLQEAAGNATQPSYIEDVFSTWLYTGNGSTQTITNGIDLAGKGGLVWIKDRKTAGWDHILSDTLNGSGKSLHSNTTDSLQTGIASVSSFLSTGFSIGAAFQTNDTGDTYASWTFRNQPKFKAQLTYTGNGGTLSVSHALGSKPGCIIIKRTDSTGDWLVIIRKSDGNIYAMYLNQTAGQFYDGTEGALWTSSSVSINWINSNVAAGFNDSGAQYVMHLFAHNAGGFGLTGTDNVISCGSYTTDASGVGSATLGWEPQWLLLKNASSAGGWVLIDNMRGFLAPGGGNSANLLANASSAESTVGIKVNATGFSDPGVVVASGTVIYIAIRRGPMKTPTSGTSVFSPQLGTSGSPAFVAGFPTDLALIEYRSGGGNVTIDRLRGATKLLDTTSTSAESTGSSSIWVMDYQNGYLNAAGSWTSQQIGWSFRRAPGFFDEVCYTGVNSGAGTQVINHNLTVVPELIILKTRNAISSWQAGTNFTSTGWRSMFLNYTNAGASQTSYANNDWFAAQPTATTFTIGGFSAYDWTAYLFASCPGVSKVGSYTGTGGTQTINCGFASRFVLIKRTDSTGNWEVFDTARGMVAGTDPHLELNATNAEVNANWVYTDASGFQIVTSDANVNASGGSYIYLAIA